MARNAEKAMTALARWRRMKDEEEKGPVSKRPHDVNECSSLADAERYRRQITAEVTKKIALIQNPGLGEFKIRDLNDEINKLLRIRYAWEIRIKELGGMDYRRMVPKELDKEGREVAGNRGYKYFGAAKDLPGVRELFEKAEVPKKNRGDFLKNLGADYYGYLDDDDGLLIPLEKEEELKARTQTYKEWNLNQETYKETRSREDDIYIYRVEDDSDVELDTKESVIVGGDGQQTFIQHVVVPSQKEIEELILQRKKALLYQKFLPTVSMDDI